MASFVGGLDRRFATLARIASSTSSLGPTWADRAWLFLVVLLLPVKTKLRLRKLLVPVRIEKFDRTAVVWLRQRSDALVLKEVFCDEAYREPWNDPSVVFDLGANIGLTALYYHLRGARRIYCFEPDPEAHRQASANLPSSVTLKRAAVTGEDGLVAFHLAPESFASSLNGPGKRINVRGLTLETAMRSLGVGHIDLLKVDIEGAEWDVLSRAPLDRIGVLVGELHAEMLNVAPKIFAETLGVTLQRMIMPSLPEAERYSFATTTDHAPVGLA